MVLGEIVTTIIVPSRYPDIFEQCRASLDQFAHIQEKILVRDGHDIFDPPGWTTIQGPDAPFIYSRNINLALNQTQGDVLLMNDDCCFLRGGTVEALEKILETCPDIGILSPKIIGGVGNVIQANVDRRIQYSNQRLAFMCVLIRRAVIDRIGLLDERFVGYGWDDDDYCRRAVDAGFKLACTNSASVTHGHGKEKRSSSFLRTKYSDNKAIFDSKWGIPQRIPNAHPVYDKSGLVQDWWSSHR
jgi:hypothetical protein